MNPPRNALAAAVTTAALFATGCSSQSAVDILRVSDIGPRQVEIGDRLEITGQHFPQASELKRVRITLRATLARSGMAPCAAPVEVTITDPPEGTSEFDPISQQMREATYARSSQRTLRLDGPDRVALVLNERIFEELTRCPGERSAPPVDHATLSFGSAHARYARLGVTVRFEGTTGTHAIEGTLRGATLDLLAPASSRVLRVDPLRRRSARVLEALGVTLADAHPTTGGLRVASVRNGGPAARAGIGANDVLSMVDGLSVLALEDMAVPENTRAVRLGVARDDIVDERTVALDGFATASPRDMLAACIALLVAIIALGLGLRSSPGVLPSLGRIVERALGGRERSAFGPWLLERFRDATRGRAKHDMIPYVVVAAPLTALGFAPLAPTLLRLGWDIGLLYALGTGLRLVSGPALSWKSLSRVLPLAIATILALATSVIASGTFRAEGIVGAQGAAPWAWHAFRSPFSVALSVLFVVGLCAAAPQRRSTSENATRSAIAKDIAGWVGTFLAACSGVTAFFGGWQVPGTDLGQQEASAALQMAGAVLFVSKAWALTLCAAWLRWTGSYARSQAIVQRSGRSILAAAFVGAVAHALIALAAPRVPQVASVALSSATFALVVVALVATLLRPRAQRRWGLGTYDPPAFRRADETVADATVH